MVARSAAGAFMSALSIAVEGEEQIVLRPVVGPWRFVFDRGKEHTARQCLARPEEWQSTPQQRPCQTTSTDRNEHSRTAPRSAKTFTLPTGAHA